MSVQRVQGREFTPAYASIHRRVHKATGFEVLSTVLFFMNMLLLIARTYVTEQSTTGTRYAVFAGEILITVLQVLELLMRYLASLDATRRERLRWWKDIVNAFDAVVLVGLLGVVGSIILPLIGISKVVKLRRFQVIRLFRLNKFVKSFRSMAVFKPLHIIMNGIAGSYVTVAFTFGLINMVLFCFAVLYLIELRESTNSYALRYFGTIEKAFYSTFQILTTESWNEMMRPVYLDHPNTVMLTTIFIGITKYLILSLITALILETAMAAVTKDEETLAAKRRAEIDNITNELTFLFQKELALSDETTAITKDEFEAAITTPTVKARMQQLGWYKTDLIDLWELLDSSGGCVLELQLLVYNIYTLRGKARTKDLLLGLKEAARALRVMDTFVDRLSSSVGIISRVQDNLVGLQGGAKQIIHGVDKIKIAIAARERVETRFQAISSITSNYLLFVSCIEELNGR